MRCIRGKFGLLAAAAILAPVLLLAVPAVAPAAYKIFPRDYTYQAGEADSKVSSRSMAMEQVKRLLLEEIGTYIETHTEVKNYELTKDQITALTAGIVKLKIVDEKWDGAKYWLKAEIVVDPDDIAKKIDRLRRDREKVEELEEAKRRVEELLRENEALKSRASKADQTAVRRYRENVKSLEAAEMLRLAQVQVNTGNLRQALEIINEAARMEPNNAEVLSMRGYVFMTMDKRSEAIRDLNRSLQLKPTALAYFYRAYAYAQINEKEKAFGDYARCLEMKPKPALASNVYNNIGYMYYQQKNLEAAFDNLNRSIALSPKYARAYANRGLAYSSWRDYSRAIGDFSRAISLEPNMGSYYYLRGNAYLDVKKYPEALSDYGQAISMSPEDKLSHVNRGVVYLRMNSLPEALADFNKAILLDPGLAMTYFNRAIVHSKMGKQSLAAADMKKAAGLGHEGAREVLRKQGARTNAD